MVYLSVHTSVLWYQRPMQQILQDKVKNESLFEDYWQSLDQKEELKRIQACENGFKEKYYQKWVDDVLYAKKDNKILTKVEFIQRMSDPEKFEWFFDIIQIKNKVKNEV